MEESLFTAARLAVVFATISAVMACVFLHYEGLSALLKLLRKFPHRHRRRILLLIFCILVLHVSEIWIFAVTYNILLRFPGLGELQGMPVFNFLDHVYFSATVYTTVGFGDIVPQGHIRFLTGVEALTGLVLITWSASFTFLEMQKFWKDK